MSLQHTLFSIDQPLMISVKAFHCVLTVCASPPAAAQRNTQRRQLRQPTPIPYRSSSSNSSGLRPAPPLPSQELALLYTLLLNPGIADTPLPPALNFHSSAINFSSTVFGSIPQISAAGGAFPPQNVTPGGAVVAIPPSATVQRQMALMHSQDRNMMHFIFGGHLLRKAFECAYGAVLVHTGCHCELVTMGDVTFLQPVPIGCLLEFAAKVGGWGGGGIVRLRGLRRE